MMTLSTCIKSLSFLLWGLLLLTLPSFAAEPVIVVLGDSLSAAYGMDIDQSWVTRLQTRLKAEGYPHRVVNASLSGETTSGGLARLGTVLKSHDPAMVIVELGANDGLRGLPLEEIQKNLARIVETSRQKGARVLLVTMRLPPNYGSPYADGFQALYEKVAAALNVKSSPFMLEGIAEQWELMQPDGIHPRAEAQNAILENLWPSIKPLL
jgi:acyl-CoA thioesterase-1